MDDDKNITENEEYEKTGQEDESESKKPKKAKKKQDDITLSKNETIGVFIYLIIAAIAILGINALYFSKAKESALVPDDEYSLVYPAKEEKTTQVISIPTDDTYGVRLYMTPDPDKNSFIIIDMLESFGLPVNQWEIHSDDIVDGYYFLSFEGLDLVQNANYYLDAWAEEDSNIGIITGRSSDYGYGSVGLNGRNWVHTTVYSSFASYIYSIELAIALLGLIAFLFYKKGKKESFVFSLIFTAAAVVFFLITPYNSVFDEEGHFLRAFEISEGKFISDKSEDSSGTATVSKELYNGIKNVTKSVKPDTRASFLYTRQENLMEHNFATDYITVDNPVQALNSPTAYIPQAIGLKLGSLFTKNVFLFYGFGRFIAFLINILLVIGAICLIPDRRLLMLAVAMNPVSLALFGSYSAEGTLLAMTLFYIAYICRAMSKDKVNLIDKAVLLLMSILIAFSGLRFLPLVLLIFLVKDEGFASKIGAKAYKCITLLASVAVGIGWYIVASGYSVPADAAGANAATGSNWIGQLFGGVFGKGLFGYNSIIWIIIGLVIIVEMIICSKKDTENVISAKGRILAVIVVILTAGIMAAGHFAMNNKMSGLFGGIQGWYFIPLILPLGLAFKRKCIEGKTESRIFIEVACLLLAVIMAAVSTVQAYL